ncbi:MAG: hypothetical protein KatS3mg124_0099 [Porticoccaceae bacterium]|nr:MAG: hypothetical protein KatS3mg124_0099 [Porticoccaceae bacterium]
MSDTLYELVLLPDGDYALQRADEEDEPLIRIRFSEEIRSLLQSAELEVAKAMLDAGIDLVTRIAEEDEEGDEAPPTLH